MTDSISTKVLVYEPNVEERQPLRDALEAHHLQGLRVDELPDFYGFLKIKSIWADSLSVLHVVKKKFF